MVSQGRQPGSRSAKPAISLPASMHQSSQHVGYSMTHACGFPPGYAPTCQPSSRPARRPTGWSPSRHAGLPAIESTGPPAAQPIGWLAGWLAGQLARPSAKNPRSGEAAPDALIRFPQVLVGTPMLAAGLKRGAPGNGKPCSAQGFP